MESGSSGAQQRSGAWGQSLFTWDPSMSVLDKLDEVPPPLLVCRTARSPLSLRA